MPYRIFLSPKASDELGQLDKPTAQQIKDKLDWLSLNIESARGKPLSGAFKGSYKLRIGDYRAIYTMDKALESIFVRFIGHRSSIYKLK
jgi:mRNA interferase RelE/StbE